MIDNKKPVYISRKNEEFTCFIVHLLNFYF